MGGKSDGGMVFPGKSYSGLPNEGMTIRDYFAGKVMESIISKHGGYEDDLSGKSAVRSFSEDAPNVDEVAIYAYTQADAMLKARNAA